MKQSLRAMPMHGYSADCDLESVYQTLSHDTVPNSNLVLFSTSDDISAVGYQHPVAGLAQHLNIKIDVFYLKVRFNSFGIPFIVDVCKYTQDERIGVKNLEVDSKFPILIATKFSIFMPKIEHRKETGAHLEIFDL